MQADNRKNIEELQSRIQCLEAEGYEIPPEFKKGISRAKIWAVLWWSSGLIVIAATIIAAILYLRYSNYAAAIDQARQCEANKDWNCAIAGYVRAFEIKSGSEADKAALAAIPKKKEEELLACIKAGKQYFMAGRLEEAKTNLQRAIDLGAGTEIKQLLDKTQEKLEPRRKAEAEAKAKAKAERYITFHGPYSQMTWAAAAGYCKKNGGRLPTVAELQAMYKAECEGGRRAAKCNCWSWSSEEVSEDRARFVRFSYGDVISINKGNPYGSFLCAR